MVEEEVKKRLFEITWKQVKSFYKKKPKTFWSALALSAVAISFLAGIESEYRYTFSKLIHPNEYKLKAEKDKTITFVDGAKSSITSWKEFYYNDNPNSKPARQKARMSAMTNSEFFTGIGTKTLPITWKIWARYFYTYLQFICLHIDGNEKCGDKAIEQIKLIEDYDRTSLSQKDLAWLRSRNLKYNTALLKAQIYAIQLKQDPSKERETLAREALKELGGQISLVNNNFHKDKILKPVYELVYGVTDSNAPQ